MPQGVHRITTTPLVSWVISLPSPGGRAFPKFHSVPDLGMCLFSLLHFITRVWWVPAEKATIMLSQHLAPLFHKLWQMEIRQGSWNQDILNPNTPASNPKPAKLLLHLPIHIFSGNSPDLVAGVLTLGLHSDCWYILLSISTHQQNPWCAFLEGKCGRQFNREATWRS